jgi:hypothetical protein
MILNYNQILTLVYINGEFIISSEENDKNKEKLQKKILLKYVIQY